MKVIAPGRLKRKRVPERAPAESTPAESAPAESAPAESAPAESAPAESAPAESTPAETTPAETTPDTRGLLRKSAVRRLLKKEFDFPLQIREAFFTAMEAKVSDDIRRSVARARELKRSTLMAPDA
jgi:histone H3/H4